MEKILFIPAIFLMLMVQPSMAVAVSWFTTNQVTITWDHAGLEGGYILPGSDVIEFEIVLSDALADPLHEDIISGDWRTPGPPYTLTLLNEGQFYVGVRAIRLRDGTELCASRYAWSSNPIDCADGLPFGIIYFIPPELPCCLSIGSH